MIELGSPWFWGIVATLAVVTRTIGPRPRLRMAAYLAAAVLVFAPAKLGWATGAGLLGVCLYGYLALRAGRGVRAIVFHVLALSSAVLASFYAPVVLAGRVPGIETVLPLAGVMYVYLRLLHLVVEVKNDRLQTPGGLEYLTFSLPFHQLYAGPIQRYPDFHAQMEAAPEPLGVDLVLSALSRITTGFIKKAVLAELLVELVGFEFETSGWELLLEIDLFALYIFLDFSGYMDIIIGAGMLVGWKPPENFDWPYLSRNIVEFWTRWHITLGTWIRDYIFNPINLTVLRRDYLSSPLLIGSLCYLASMVFCGFWHRPDLQFGLWGLVHGLGIIACKIYETLVKRALGRKGYRAYMDSRWSGAAATFITFQYVALSFVLAFNPPGRALAIFGELW